MHTIHGIRFRLLSPLFLFLVLLIPGTPALAGDAAPAAAPKAKAANPARPVLTSEPCGGVDAYLARLEPTGQVAKHIFERTYRERARKVRDVAAVLKDLAATGASWKAVQQDFCDGRLDAVRTALAGAAAGDKSGDVLFALGGVAYLARDYSAAAHAYAQALALDQESPRFLEAVAEMHYLVDDYGLAASLFSKAWRSEEKLHGATAFAAELAEWVGDTHLAAGDDAFAAQVYTEAAAMYDQVLGTSSPESGTARAKIGTALIGAGKLDDAESALRAALSVFVKGYGPDNPLVAETLRSLGLVRDMRKEYKQAEELYASALVSAANWYGLDSPDLAPYMASIGAVRTRLGNYDSALEILRDARASAVKLYGEKSPRIGEIDELIKQAKDAKANAAKDAKDAKGDAAKQ
ncbi:Tetratricopeptide TPR_2 repeat-containing protein [Desulfovibrio sp. X2]|uniref:tetratricopeptide repeat protein n=1 Tax=Desulfovibrio sp. X2 TaxID=941449 RepID=UPI000358CB2B|nr:tetratricopeptide repeat protein [Desulfovibrio sp. X2]EPR37088.1 Tetratricopeptide TPR_2 repeat-containing protein [Desulfovibrio sp. X2]